MVHVPLMFLSEWREFPSTPCLAGKKNLMTARVSMLLKLRASPDMLPFSICNKKKTCNSAHEQIPLSNDTIDSVLRHREVGRANDLSSPPLIQFWLLSLKIYSVCCHTGKTAIISVFFLHLHTFWIQCHPNSFLGFFWLAYNRIYFYNNFICIQYHPYSLLGQLFWLAYSSIYFL